MATKNKTKPSLEAYQKSVHHFMYFIFNFPNRFWEKAFEKEPEHLKDHISSKFLNSYKEYGPSLGVIKFFMELDVQRRNDLMEWVRDNYDGYEF